MPDGNIKVTALPRSNGIDIDRLALALIEFVEHLPKSRRDQLTSEGKALLDSAKTEVGEISQEGAA